MKSNNNLSNIHNRLPFFQPLVDGTELTWLKTEILSISVDELNEDCKGFMFSLK